MSAGTLGRWRAYAGLAGRVLRSRFGAPRPFKVTWMLTDRCDCRCEGCRIWERAKRPEPAPAEIERVLAAAPSVRWVNLTGGEPFLRDDVAEVGAAVARALPGLVVLDLPTTGQRTEAILEAVERLLRLGLPRLLLTVSVEGPPELHDRQRGRPGAFERATATFRALRRLARGARGRLGVWLGMTLHAQNADRVLETLAAACAPGDPVGWADLHVNVYTVSGHYYQNADAALRPPEGLDDLLRHLRRARGRWGRPEDWIEGAYLARVPEYLRTGRSPLPCQALRASVFIDTRGDVHPCTVYGRVLGNVRADPLYAILEGAEARAARAVVARDACPGCWSPCEAFPTIVAGAPASLGPRDEA